MLVTTAPSAPTRRRRRWRRSAPPTRAPRSRRCSRSPGRSTARRRWRGSKTLPLPGANGAIWLSDGVDDGGGAKALADYLDDRGSLRYLAAGPGQAPLLLAAGDREAKDLTVGAALAAGAEAAPLRVRASGADGRLLARQQATIEPGATSAEARCAMPSELQKPRRRASRSKARQSAGRCCWSTSAGGAGRSASPRRPTASGQPLLSENYYLERALGAVHRNPPRPRRRSAEAPARGADLSPMSGPDSPAEAAAVEKWVEAGGMLLRFAGPHLAEQDDKLLPVRLRRGGRTIGGAMSWEQPAKLAPFAADSPFAGLVDPGRRDGVAPGAGRARHRPRRQDLGAARRRHPARHRRKARARLDRAGAHDGECRLVQSGALRAVCRDAAADRRR